MSAPIPLRDYAVVRTDPLLAALFEDLRLHLRPGDVPMVTDIPDDPIYPRYRVWVRFRDATAVGSARRTFGPHRPTLAQAIDGLIAKLR